MTILVVDDDPDICTAFAEALDEAGYTVEIAHDGLEAIRYLRAATRPPSAILLDLMMPAMDGWQLDAWLGTSAFADVPVVVMTASRDALPPRATRCLLKPFSIEALVEAAATATRR